MNSLENKLKTSDSDHHTEIITELGLDAFCFKWGVYGSLLGSRGDNFRPKMSECKSG